MLGFFENKCLFCVFFFSKKNRVGGIHVCLILTPKEATAVAWAIMTCPFIDTDNTC